MDVVGGSIGKRSTQTIAHLGWINPNNSSPGQAINPNHSTDDTQAMDIRIGPKKAKAWRESGLLKQQANNDMYISFTLSLSLYIYIYVHTYIYLYIYIYIHMYLSLYMYIYICIYTYMYTYIYIYIERYIHIYVYVCIYVCVYIYIYICRQTICVIHTYG